MAPMTRFACTEDGSPTEELSKYYLKRAENDLGLIIIERAQLMIKMPWVISMVPNFIRKSMFLIGNL